jgi:large subunit ribosomal protein L21
MTYAIISLGGKQYRVQEGQRLVVDRLAHGHGKTFHPDVLFIGGGGQAEFAPKGTQVTAKVLGETLGEKIRIGKYKRRTGYRRHTGHRAKLTQIEITAIGAKTATRTTAEKPKPAAAASGPAAATPKTEKPATAAKPKPAATAKPKEPDEGSSAAQAEGPASRPRTESEGAE